MKLNYLVRLEGKIYQPVMIKLDGVDVMDLVEVACGYCKGYADCEGPGKDWNYAYKCGKFKV